MSQFTAERKGSGSVRRVKNRDLRLENAARGRRAKAAFTRPRSQFFTKLGDEGEVSYVKMADKVVVN